MHNSWVSEAPIHSPIIEKEPALKVWELYTRSPRKPSAEPNLKPRGTYSLIFEYSIIIHYSFVRIYMHNNGSRRHDFFNHVCSISRMHMEQMIILII